MDYDDTRIARVSVLQLDGEIRFMTERHSNGKVTVGMIRPGRPINAKEAKVIKRRVPGSRYGDIGRIIEEILRSELPTQLDEEL